MLLIGIVCRLRPASPHVAGDRQARHSVKEDRNGGNRSGTMIHLDRLLQGKMRYDKLIKTHKEEKTDASCRFHLYRSGGGFISNVRKQELVSSGTIASRQGTRQKSVQNHVRRPGRKRAWNMYGT